LERKTLKDDDKKYYQSLMAPADIQIKPKSKSEFQIHFPPGNVETKMREFVDDQKLLHKLINSKLYNRLFIEFSFRSQLYV
jgi:hypothetical protein